MGRRRHRKRAPREGVITSLSREGRGVVPAFPPELPRDVHVDGALAGERVMFRKTRRKGDHHEAELLEILEASPERIEGRCQHYGMCGGCNLQHMPHASQLDHKQAVLLGDMEAVGHQPERVLEALKSEPWAYRRRARLGVKWVEGKGRVLVGFREKDNRFVADIRRCEVLDERAAEIMEPLARLVEGLSIRSAVPQVEVSAGDETLALVFRVLEPPSDADLEAMRRFAADSGLQIHLQPGGLETVAPLEGAAQANAPLFYEVDETSAAGPIGLRFVPTDFIQVNGPMNRIMIARAIELLALEPEHQVLDLFCGLGNFSLPIARRVARLVGIEGELGLVERARANASRAGIDSATFMVRDLYDSDLDVLPELAAQTFDRVLIDPPRTGCETVVRLLCGSPTPVPRIVYVSCGPQSLARDTAILVDGGYALAAAGIIDMFPHTAHVESIAVFEHRSTRPALGV